jgi:DNA-binding SARP family transcriptional activator
MLRIWLFGVLRLEVDGSEVAPPSSRGARMLLAMLALERRPHSRQALAARLWPGVLDESARASLRTALTQLRAALGPDAGRLLMTTREDVALAGPEEVWTDVGELERLLREGRVQAALELWGEELLTGLENEWVDERRDALRQLLGEALGSAADEAEARGDLEAALQLTRRHVALDPLSEESQRGLIRRLAALGETAAALAAFDKLSQRLRDRLGMAPSAATRELAEAVRAGAVPPASPKPAPPRAAGRGEAADDRVEWISDGHATVDLLQREPLARVLATRLRRLREDEPGRSFLIHIYARISAATGWSSSSTLGGRCASARRGGHCLRACVTPSNAISVCLRRCTYVSRRRGSVCVAAVRCTACASWSC